MSALFNGAPADAAWSGTRALHYGDGVFRTLLVAAGTILDEEGQWKHLARDAAALDLDVDETALRSEAAAHARTAGDGVLKAILSRRAGARGYAPGTRETDRLLRIDPRPVHGAHCWSAGVDLAWSPVLLGIQPRLARIKHLNRLEQVLASREIPQGAQEAMMCDAEGRIVCGTRCNVFFVTEGVLRTPDLSRSGVAGRMRHRVLELAEDAGLESYAETIAPDEVRHSQECFLTNSIIGIWPVRRLGTTTFAAPGPVTARLRALLAHPFEGAA